MGMAQTAGRGGAAAGRRVVRGDRDPGRARVPGAARRETDLYPRLIIDR